MRLIFILLCFVSMNVCGQTNSSQGHLSFRGIPITGKYDTFIKKVILSGYSRAKDHNPTIPNHLRGDFGGIGGFYINVKKDNNGNVYGLTLQRFAECASDWSRYYSKIVNVIEKTYPKNFQSKFSGYISDGSDWGMYYDFGSFRIYDIRGKNGIQLGEISVKQVYNLKYGMFEILVDFTDHRNALIYDPYYKLSQKRINMTEYSSLKRLSMIDTGKELLFQGVLGNGKGFNFSAFNNDRNYIVSLLNSDLKKDEVKYIMNLYINRCFERARKFTLNDNLFANAHIMEGIREELAEIKKQKERQSNNNFSVVDFLHLLAPGVFTQNDVDLYNNMPQSSQSLINSVVGSFFSGRYYTNEEMIYPDYESRFR